ncbi:DUF2161 family putative PD-(D/E)XK-type phosphodiesterase [Peptostreptococcaceae bacterium AGR-M142]
MSDKMKETYLYLPIKELFSRLGYDVQAEVGEIDVLATKEEDFVVIELKKDLNLKLIVQGAQRQKLSEIVYVAIPKPTYKIRMSSVFQEKVYLIRRLGIGLVFVNFKKSGPVATIEEDPFIFDLKQSQRLNKKTRERALKEKSLRSGDYNLGGQKGTKITAYKENVILVAALLSQNGVMKVAEVKKTAGEKAGAILRDNHYGWFERVKTGYYQLSLKGQDAVNVYDYIIEKLL